jgi:cytochrome c oxidase subunit 2
VPANGPRRFREVASRALLRAAVLSIALFAACGDEPKRAEEGDLGSGLPDRPPRGLTPEKWGERLFIEHGCLGCHTIHGARSVGGSLAGIWGAPRTFADGSTGTVDEAYVRESIDSPSEKVVDGFGDAMPSYRQRLSQAQVDALVAFLATRR